MRYKPQKIDYDVPTDEWLQIMKDNQKELDKIDKEAKEKGTLLYRYISEPVADGQAVYQITKVNKNTVKIEVCTGLGDDWQIPYWGQEATIERDYAEQKIQGKDNLAKIFS